jgi:hypothetical protein
LTIQKQFDNAVNDQNINEITALLKHTIVNPTHFSNFAIGVASRTGSLHLVKLLLKDSRVNPSDNYNFAINEAYIWEYDCIIQLLWNDERVKNTLKKDNLNLYNILTNKDVQQKIEYF